MTAGIKSLSATCMAFSLEDYDILSWHSAEGNDPARTGVVVQEILRFAAVPSAVGDETEKASAAGSRSAAIAWKGTRSVGVVNVNHVVHPIAECSRFANRPVHMRVINLAAEEMMVGLIFGDAALASGWTAGEVAITECDVVEGVDPIAIPKLTA